MNAVVELPFELRPPIVVERPKGSGVFVRLSDSYLRSIAYIGCARPGEDGQIDTHGTGFLLAHDGHVYLVTAAHVAVDFLDGPMAVRLNKSKDGLGDIEHFDSTNWFFHPDRTVDVAVMPISVPLWARADPLKSKTIATEFKVGTKDFGAGDLAYVVGIFNKMRGENKNEPFVHTGHIASMGYGETAVMEDWRPGAKAGSMVSVKGYFVQATTLPESSGSPVFVRRSIETKVHQGVEKDGKTYLYPLRSWIHGSVWLLGLWSGNWESKDHARGIIVGDDMGLCIPASRILEVVDCAELKAMRETARNKESQEVALKQTSREKSITGDQILKNMMSMPPAPRVTKSKGKKKPA